MKSITIFLLSLLTIMPSFAVEYSNEQLYDLWEKYYHGKDVEKNELLALSYLREAADKDYGLAQYKLGMLYQNGTIVNQSDSLAFFWFQKGNKSPNCQAKMQYSLCYFLGMGVEVNDSIAYSCFNKLVECSDSTISASAEFFIAYMHEKGRGRKVDISKAIEWYTKSANHGEVNAMAQLGIIYVLSGKATENIPKGLKWTQKCVALNNSVGQRVLAKMYSLGIGVEKDLEKSFQLYKLAADQGDVLSIAELAQRYIYKEEYENALHYLYLGVEQDNAVCQLLLGKMYFLGEGVEKDIHKAIGFYQLSAQQGLIKAYIFLGAAYAEGMGVEKDMNKAKVLFEFAAQHGDEEAKSILNQYFQ